MSDAFYEDMDLLVKFANLTNNKAKIVKESREYLKETITLVVKELNKLIRLNKEIDSMISNAQFLKSIEYNQMCTQSYKLFQEIHSMPIVRQFESLIELIDCSDEELAELADKFIYLIYIHEEDIKARQSMAFSWLYSK
ncbi:MAG: hypothetical protein ORN24_06190 [Burkholderiales bacterium]|nr:hypothetical protein [Burkholderiales bacterium]